MRPFLPDWVLPTLFSKFIFPFHIMPQKASTKATKNAEKSSSKPKGSDAPATKDAASKKETAAPKAPSTSKTSSGQPKKAELIKVAVPAIDTAALEGLGPVKPQPVDWTPWLKKQKQKLIELRDSMLDALEGATRETLRSRAEGSEASAFGMHQADAGSDAYDRDFALSMLSKEQDALYEIEEALKRVELGTYGICEMSHKKIPQLRLEAIPFARYTVECQAQLEKENRGSYGRRPPVRSLFGLGGDDDDEDEDSEGGSSNNSDSND